MRLAKSGKEIWTQARYNPILGPSDKPFKVAKYATDITDRVRALGVDGVLTPSGQVLQRVRRAL